MKIVINEDDYGRVVRTPGAFNVYTIELEEVYGLAWKTHRTFVLNRENVLRLQEDIRIWIKENTKMAGS